MYFFERVAGADQSVSVFEAGSGGDRTDPATGLTTLPPLKPSAPFPPRAGAGSVHAGCLGPIRDMRGDLMFDTVERTTPLSLFEAAARNAFTTAPALADASLPATERHVLRAAARPLR